MGDYYKHLPSESVHLKLGIYISNSGVVGLDPICAIRRSSDNKYFDGAVWNSSEQQLDMAEYSSSVFPGLYVYDFTQGQVPEVYTVKMGMPSGTYYGFGYEQHEFISDVNAASVSGIKAKTDLMNFSGSDIKATLDGEQVVVSNISAITTPILSVAAMEANATTNKSAILSVIAASGEQLEEDIMTRASASDVRIYAGKV